MGLIIALIAYGFVTNIKYANVMPTQVFNRLFHRGIIISDLEIKFWERTEDFCRGREAGGKY